MVQFSQTSISINLRDRGRRDCNLDGWWLAAQEKTKLSGFVIFLKSKMNIKKSKINASSSHIKWSVGDNEIQCVGLAEKAP